MLEMTCQHEDTTKLVVASHHTPKETGLWFNILPEGEAEYDVLLDPEQIQVLHEQLGAYLSSIGATFPNPKFRGDLNAD
jgi:hypothetical protein